MLPDYFFSVSASSTGKYHPSFSLGNGGLLRHTKVVVKIAYELLAIDDRFTDNDKDLRTPSPEPIYDPRSGQRMNTREMRNKEKFMKQKNLLIAELIQFDEDYIPPKGYKPPKLTHKIYIMNNEKYLFTR